MRRASRYRKRSTSASLVAGSYPPSRGMLLHDLRVVTPHPAQVILIHRVAGRTTFGKNALTVQTATDELPVIALRVHPELVALHDLDVVGRYQPAGTEAELVLTESRLVDLSRRALQQQRMVVDVCL